MHHLTRNDYAGALRLIAGLEPATGDARRFATAAVSVLSDFVASELTTLSVRDLVTGHRHVVGPPGVRLSPGDIEGFDRHFFEHPLVRYHGVDGAAAVMRALAMRKPDGEPLAALL